MKISIHIRYRDVEVYVPGFHPIVTVKLFVAALRANRSIVTLDQFVTACIDAGMTVKKVRK